MRPDRFSAQGELDAMVADYRTALTQADPMEALQRWHESAIGYRPDSEPVTPEFPHPTLDELARECRDYLRAFAADTGARLPADLMVRE